MKTRLTMWWALFLDAILTTPDMGGQEKERLRSLARRRADLERMKTKALRVRPWDVQAKAANHLANCSCWKCGNPRRWHQELTLDEQRALEAFHADLRDPRPDHSELPGGSGG